MTKPTLLQTLFNQPSRSYVDLYSNQDFYTLQPPKRQRRSYDGASPANSRRSSLRLSGSSFATAFNFSDLPTILPTPPSKDDAGLKKTMEDKAKSTPRSALAQPAGSTPWPPRSNLAAAAVEHRPISTASNSSSTQDFQEAPERHSWALSSASTSRSATPRASLVEPPADTSTSSAPLHPTRRPPSMSRRLRKQRKSRTEEEIIALQSELGEMGIMDKQDVRRDSLREAVAEEGEEEDLFFTPPTSPPGSPNQTLTGKQYFPSLESAALHAERQEEDQNGYSSPTKTPRALRRRRPIASPVKDGATPIRSASPSDDSSSDESFSNWRSSSSYAPSLSTAPTSVSGFSGSSPKSSSPTKSSRQPAHTSISTSTSSRGSTKSSHGKQLDSTSADWAKGVKWLGASEGKPARPPRSWTHSRRSSVDLSTSGSSASSIFDHPVVIDRSERRRSFDSSTSNDRPNRWDLMGDSNKGPSRHKRSNSMGSHHGPGSSGGVVGTRRRHTRARTSAAADAEMQKRMSAVLEVDDDGEVIGTSVVPASQHAYGSPRPPSLHGRSRSSPGHAGSRPQSVMSRSSGTSSYRTVELPSIPATTDGQVTYPNGFTSLTLPRAAVTADEARGPDLFSGHVDLAKSGLAQVTMGTISIIKGAAMVSKTPPTTLARSTSRLRRLSRSFTSSSNKGKETETPARLQSGVEHALAFTTSTSTPSKYGPSQMIVKIFAAGISELDRLVVRNKVRAKADEGYGFVPGRAFVGKVLETGWEVNDVRSGDWVMGLTELSTSTSASKHSGTLAEYVVVDRTRVSRAPKPGLMLWPGASSGLTMEQIVMLPLVAVFAHRAIKTFPHAAVTMRRTVPSMSPPASPRKTRKGKEKEQVLPPQGLGKIKVLVVGAHTDVGDLVVQEFMLRDDLVVTVQVPTGTDVLVWEGLDTVEVIQGDVETVLGNLPNGVFVMVVDCVGGESVWKGSRRVLDPRCGQFTSLVGDDPNAIPTRQAYTKSSLRSLKHAFIRSGGKTLGYEWVCPAVDIDTEGDDIRTNLAEITRLVEQGSLIPPIPRKVVMFESGMGAFKDGEDGLCAVKVVG